MAPCRARKSSMRATPSQRPQAALSAASENWRQAARSPTVRPWRRIPTSPRRRRRCTRLSSHTQRTTLPAPVIRIRRQAQRAGRPARFRRHAADGGGAAGPGLGGCEFKESQLADVRVGQTATVISDLYGNHVEYRGRVAGFGAGTGAAFALLPARNATGNWIKVVQRVPVRVVLDPRRSLRTRCRSGCRCASPSRRATAAAAAAAGSARAGGAGDQRVRGAGAQGGRTHRAHHPGQRRRQAAQLSA